MTGLLIAPWCGAWVDRSTDRRRLMLLADGWRATTALGLAAVHHTWQVAAFASLTALGTALYHPARGGLMLQLVGRGKIGRYNGWRAVVVGPARLAGPLLAGIALSRLGVGPSLALNAAGYAASAVATLCVRARPETAPEAGRSVARRLRPRAAYAWTAGDPVVRGALAVWSWTLAGLWCVNTLWFVWVQAVPFGGPTVMGAAIAAYEGGSMVAGAVLVRYGSRARPGVVLVLATAVCACWCALDAVHSSAAVVALCALEGIAAWWLRLFLPTLIQQRAPADIAGGALAVEGQLDDAGHLAGVALAAVVAAVAAPPTGFLVAAGVAVTGFGLTTAAFQFRTAILDRSRPRERNQ